MDKINSIQRRGGKGQGKRGRRERGEEEERGKREERRSSEREHTANFGKSQVSSHRIVYPLSSIVTCFLVVLQDIL